jgi:uncharacterized protein affecting Mg2+/Co2+ transport
MIEPGRAVRYASTTTLQSEFGTMEGASKHPYAIQSHHGIPHAAMPASAAYVPALRTA